MSKQTRYADKQKNERGMVRVSVWVPERLRQKLLDFAEKLRSEK